MGRQGPGPASGTSSQDAAREQERMETDAAVGGGDALGSFLSPGGDDAVDRSRDRVRGRRRGRRPPPRPRSPSAARPHRSDAPGPRSQSGQRTERAVVSTSWAPSTTTTSSIAALARTRSRTGSSSTACFGEPKRVDAPAASTTAEIIPSGYGVTSMRRTTTRRVGFSFSGLPRRPIFLTVFNPLVTMPRIA